MMVKIVLIIIGVLIIILGLFLSLAIILYSGKEQDSSGYYFLIISLTILIFGVLILFRGISHKGN